MNSPFLYRSQPPLEDRLGASQVRSANLHRLPELVSHYGGHPEAMFERHSVDRRAVVSAEHPIACQAVVDMLEDCAVRFNEPLFGLRLAQLQAPDVYGCIATLCRAAPDLRTAINCLIDYVPVLHSSESILHLVEGARVSELRWTMHSDLGANDQANCHGLLLNFKVLQMLVGSQLSARYVRLPLSIFRQTSADIARALGCAVRRDRDTAAIAFPTPVLDTPIYSANPSLFRWLAEYAAQLKPVPKPDLAQQVRDYLQHHLVAGDPSVGACAAEIGLSARTLQEQLKRRGQSYSRILESHRFEQAKTLLAVPATSIAEIADLLGYAEHTSFGRAFKRWAGLSPRAFRERAGQ